MSKSLNKTKEEQHTVALYQFEQKIIYFEGAQKKK